MHIVANIGPRGTKIALPTISAYALGDDGDPNDDDSRWFLSLFMYSLDVNTL